MSNRTKDILAAYFTNGSKTRSPTLQVAVITPAGQRTFLNRWDVADKRAARRLAKAAGATPWNF